jgi:plasmid maintenance system killer protein
MFLLAREEVKKRVSNNLDLKRAGSHQVIINTLKELKFYNIADKLNGLRLMRVNADYCLGININHDSVNKALQLAKNIYELIQLHMKSDTV